LLVERRQAGNNSVRLHAHADDALQQVNDVPWLISNSNTVAVSLPFIAFYTLLFGIEASFPGLASAKIGQGRL
jgi:hypothetical protein